MAFDLPTIPFDGPALVFAVLMTAVLVAPMLARLIRLPEIVVVVMVGFAIGPTGMGLLERGGVVEMLGTAGLLYLMFVAGLELDLDDFVDHRRDSLGFGTATFVVPMLLGTVTSLALGFEFLAAVLLASCWASHTLVSYPVFQRIGTVANRAVATSVGATIITDTAALLVLAVVARAYVGELSAMFWVTLVPALAVATLGVLFGLPRLARWFFSRWGQDPSLRFLFVLVCLFAVASLFELIGIEAIVGAFLAGLALNRNVPNGGLLMQRVDFFGGAFFIPLFLLATGMLIDLQVLAEPRTLLMGATFTAVALASKLLAALTTGKLLGYDRAEVGAMFSLSVAQAAATLAAIVVGLNVGLLDEGTVNAVMMVILVTCLVSPAAASRYAARLPRPEVDRDLGDVVVVPVANPSTAPGLIRVASAFARADGGLVVPVMVVSSDAEREQFSSARELEAELTEVAQSAGAEARTVLRIDTTPAIGVAHTVAEQQGSLLVVGWNGQTSRREAAFGGIIDGILSSTSLPTLVFHDGGQEIQRILLLVDESVTTPAGLPALDLAATTTKVMQREKGAPTEVITNHQDRLVDERVHAVLEAPVQHDLRRRSIAVKEYARTGDLLVVPSIGDAAHLRAAAARVALATPEGASLLVALDNSAAVESSAVIPQASAWIGSPRHDRLARPQSPDVP